MITFWEQIEKISGKRNREKHKGGVIIRAFSLVVK